MRKLTASYFVLPFFFFLSYPSPNANLWSLRPCGNGAALPRVPPGRRSQSCVWFLCARLCMSKRKTRPVALSWFRAGILALPWSAGDRGQVSALPVLALGPAFPLQPQLCWVNWSHPLFFDFFFFQTTWEGLGWTSMSNRNTSKILKMVRVSNYTPAPLCIALPTF